MATEMAATSADAVRGHAQAACDALLAGDVDGLIGQLSEELKRNLGEVVALLPLPLREAEITTLEQNGKATIVTMALTGETDAVDLTTRWKDRDGEPRIVEVSHVATTPPPASMTDDDDPAADAEDRAQP
jgi:hypothetical protein